MERRDVLKSAATAATASTAALAGCGGILGGGCGTPDNIENAVPEGGDYKMQGNVTTRSSQTQQDVNQSASASYTGPNDELYFFSVSEFKSADAASNATDNIGEEANSSNTGNTTVGYIQSGKYVYVGFGPDEESVTQFMSQSPTLGDCVEGNIQFV